MATVKIYVYKATFGHRFVCEVGPLGAEGWRPTAAWARKVANRTAAQLEHELDDR